jgi:hypothetical protein
MSLADIRATIASRGALASEGVFFNREKSTKVGRPEAPQGH